MMIVLESQNNRPSRNTQPVRYARRELLGFSDDDEMWIEGEISNFIKKEFCN